MTHAVGGMLVHWTNNCPARRQIVENHVSGNGPFTRRTSSNPTLTTVAFALRCADAIAASH